MLIDSEARASFSGRATNSMLKIVCGYIRCIERESWEHIILCVKNEELREEFLFTLKEKLLAVEGTEDVIHETL